MCVFRQSSVALDWPQLTDICLPGSRMANAAAQLCFPFLRGKAQQRDDVYFMAPNILTDDGLK